MAWLGKVSLGGFPDIAGTVAKLSESVKNIEKNFDSALGLEEKSDNGEASGIWPSASDRRALFEPVMAFMGHKEDDSSAEVSEKPILEKSLSAEEHDKIHNEESPSITEERTTYMEDHEVGSSRKNNGDSIISKITPDTPVDLLKDNVESEENLPHPEIDMSTRGMQVADVVASFQQNDIAEVEVSDEPMSTMSNQTSLDSLDHVESHSLVEPDEIHHVSDSKEIPDETDRGKAPDEGSLVHSVVPGDKQASTEVDSFVQIPVILEPENSSELIDEQISNSSDFNRDRASTSDSVPRDVNDSSESAEGGPQGIDINIEEQHPSTTMKTSYSVDPVTEVEKVRKEMKLMEAALQGAARQAQAKADEIANLMNENEQLKSVIENLKRKSSEAEVDSLRVEYHQRVSSLERKVYALTKERDTLRREQNKKSDAAALLREKDEIISQVMAEGEELSKKQANQESTIRKLRAQIREFEEEKQKLNSKLQVEETKADSLKREKAAKEKLLQETIERNHTELAAQKEFYTNALNAAKEAEELAEARANNEARIELEGQLREAGERESMLVQSLEELRQTLSRTEQQAAYREDMLQRDIDDLQKRYQASELRYNELIAQVPESTRPLLRQIEAMQETSARRAEAWAVVERALNSRLQEAEAKAAGAEERERAMNERLSQNLSRTTVLETQISCLRAEITQLNRSLEKERQRASENRQEHLVVMENAATQEGRAKQLEDEIKELRNKYKHELQEEVTHRELLEKELERERIARIESEKTIAAQTPAISTSYAENGNAPLRKLSSAGSLSSMEESLFLQASLDSSDSYFSERRIHGEAAMSPYFLKSMTPSAFEAALRQKDGELASYISRLASLESIRDSLAEELVKMTAECEKLRGEAAILPGLRAELEALRRRHSSALELMGERDEELEELRADIIDLKEMYREQVDLLVNRIQTLSSTVATA